MTRLLSISSVAARLDVSSKTVRRWIASGTFPQPITLPGGHQRWTEISIEVWIQNAATEKPVPKQDAVKGKS